MSWGIIQWNFGQDTLGPLLRRMKTADINSFNGAFSNATDLTTLNTALAGTKNQQMSWAIDMQTNKNQRWKDIFKNLASIAEFQEIQLEAVAVYDKSAIKIIKWMKQQKPDLMNGVKLATFVALHDLAIQQGGLKNSKPAIITEINAKPPNSQDEFIRIVVTKRGETASSRWRADCISRRLGILNKKRTKITRKGYTADRDNPSFDIIEDVIVCDL